MKYVIDASTAFQWEVPEPDSLQAIQLREDYRNGIHELISPDIFPAEVGNALIVAERKGRIVAGQFAVRLTAILASVRVISSPPSRQVSDSAFTMPSTWPWPSVRVAISFLAMASWCGIFRRVTRSSSR